LLSKKRIEHEYFLGQAPTVQVQSRWNTQQLGTTNATSRLCHNLQARPCQQTQSHTVLYFGQADDLSQQALRSHNHVLDFWANNGGDESELFVFILAMPDSTRWERASVQEQLVSEYNPDCNRY
jgi:hypothetical protein